MNIVWRKREPTQWGCVIVTFIVVLFLVFLIISSATQNHSSYAQSLDTARVLSQEIKNKPDKISKILIGLDWYMLSKITELKDLHLYTYKSSSVIGGEYPLCAFFNDSMGNYYIIEFSSEKITSVIGPLALKPQGK